MADETKGTAHVWGVNGTVTNATVQSFNKNERFGVSAETKDENGITIERRYDDRHTDATLVLRIQSDYTIQAIGSEITYDGDTYEIVTVNESENNEGHKLVEYGLLESEGISY